MFLAYASPRGRALIDRRLYLPRVSWLADPGRCQAAGIAPQTTFMTKPALAAAMIAAALDAGVPARWVTGDEVYGQDPALRDLLHQRGVGYVLAISCRRQLTVPGLVTQSGAHGRTATAADLAAQIDPAHWYRYSAGPGAKGPRLYAWAWLRIDIDQPGHRWLLIRRSLTTGELAFYRCYAPTPVSLAALVRVAGARWAIEECFQTAKGQVGLDHYQVRGWTGWHRHITLAMLALAFLAVIAVQTATATGTPTSTPTSTAPAGAISIALTVPEIRRLIASVLNPVRRIDDILHWSQWRRRHQARARHSHYQRRSQP